MISRYHQSVLATIVTVILFSLSVRFFSESFDRTKQIAGFEIPALLKTHDNQTHDNRTPDDRTHGDKTQNNTASTSVRNTTLGFEKVFLLNLPERTDKLDMFTLASSVTGFTFDVIEGVKGQGLNNKSLPSLNGAPTSDNPDKYNIIGCWRAHMNAAQAIVRNRLSSALIIEDDSDWDTHLKDQLELFAQGSQFVTGIKPGITPHSPYGDDWDLLWLGHCSAGIGSDIDRRLVIENDFTVPPIERRVNYASVPDFEKKGYDNSTRLVFQANWGVCMYAYALSFRGAQKLLRVQNMVQGLEPIDLSIGGMCGDEFKCVSVFPQLFDSHRSAGNPSRDTDMRTSDEEETREVGYTNNIVYSTKLNLDLLLKDATAKPKRQWPEDPIIHGPPRPKLIGQPIEQIIESDGRESRIDKHNERR